MLRHPLLATLMLTAAGHAAAAEESAPRHPIQRVKLEAPLLAGHPRLVFVPEGAGLKFGRPFARPRQLFAADPTFQAIFKKALVLPEKQQNPVMLAACWVVSGEERFAREAILRITSEQLKQSSEPYYSAIWQHALAFDWLYRHPSMTPEVRAKAIATIAWRLERELDELDGDGLAMWHGRTQQANNSMIAALAIGDERPELLDRAAAHYLEALRALQFSEGWPEGASYWIYNRAGPFALAADCVMTALQRDRLHGLPIRDIMRTIGYWQLYQFAPNGVFEPFGDSSGSLRLGDTGWWELTTDHYAKLSGDPGLMAGADYLRNRSPTPYGRRPYYWQMALTYEPTTRPTDAYDPAQPEIWMRRHLPRTMLFGRRSCGLAFFRGDWGDPDELFACFKAGDLLAHHDHYDCGTFTIQYGAPLVVHAGSYHGDYFGQHRLGYLIQTVSKNSLLILAPGEKTANLARFEKLGYSSLAGGQRVIRPTGFYCLSVDHFRAQLNAESHLERADITAFTGAPDSFDYIAADITAAYNSTRWAETGSVAKVSLVTRQWLYLRPEKAFVIHDRVDTTDAAFLPKFVLQSPVKPASATERLLAGNSPDDGILETTDATLVTTYRRGRLTRRSLLPAATRTLKIGGTNFHWYVEEDGSQSDGFDGVNLVQGHGAPHRPISTRPGQWRTETEPLAPTRTTRFLNVLLPRLADDAAPLPPVELLTTADDIHAVRVGATVAVFARAPAPVRAFRVAAPGAKRCLLLDAVPNATYQRPAPATSAQTDAEGVLLVDAPAAGIFEAAL
jgi:hypothetical protein